ncbi:MAG: Ig-like domain-containing protein [bacterium]
MSRASVIRPAIVRGLLVVALQASLLACGGGESAGPAAIASIQITGGATSVLIGASTTLTATARDKNGGAVSGATFTWSSAATSVATVSQTGTVTGVAAGTTTISVSSGGFSASTLVTVTPDNTPASITLSQPSPLTLPSGTSVSFSATVRAVDGHVVANAPVTFSSSDATIANVVGTGLVAFKVGTATITASSGALSASIVVTVTVGAAAIIALRAQPVGGVSGTPLTTQPVLEVRDGGGNLVTSSQIPVTALLLAGGGTLSGTTTVNAVNGVATFTDLAVTGTAGIHRLAFSAPPQLGVASADFTITTPPTPLLVIDTTAVTFTAPAGATQSLTLGVKNGGVAPVTGVSVDAPVYDPGQPTGWLTATLAGSVAPYLLTLQAKATLAVGAYRAVVKVNGSGATNSPVSVVVTLVVTNNTFIVFGAATEKLRVLDVGGSYTPATSAKDGAGQPTTPGTVTYTSRATSVATVDGLGKITARGEGQTYVVAQGAASADSVFVTVARAIGGPVLTSDLTSFVVKAGDATTINIYLDARATQVGAVSVGIGYTTAVGTFSNVSITIPAGPPVPVVSSQTPGVFRVSVASGTPLTGQIAVLRLRFVTPTAGMSGVITLTVTDIAGSDGTDLLPITTSTRIPVIVQ